MITLDIEMDLFVMALSTMSLGTHLKSLPPRRLTKRLPTIRFLPHDHEPGERRKKGRQRGKRKEERTRRRKKKRKKEKKGRKRARRARRKRKE